MENGRRNGQHKEKYGRGISLLLLADQRLQAMYQVWGGSMIYDAQRRYLFDLVGMDKEFQEFMGENLWEADYPDVMKFLQGKFPYLKLPDDINDLESHEASFLISSLKNL